jgi:hypothetical protein
MLGAPDLLANQQSFRPGWLVVCGTADCSGSIGLSCAFAVDTASIAVAIKAAKRPAP